MEHIFFNGWTTLFRTFIVGILAYISIVFLLRISGKRTLSKMNAFDFIVTIALGSTLATVLLNKNVSLSEGMLAFALLIFLQYAITWSTVRSKSISKMVKSEPTLLLYNGEFLQEALRKERVTDEEVLAAIREIGAADVRGVHAVVIETDGTLSVIPKEVSGSLSSLKGVQRRKKYIEQDV